MRPGDERLSHIPDNASVISTLARMGVETFAEIAADLGAVQMNVTAIDPMRPDPDTTTHYYRDNPEVKDRIVEPVGAFRPRDRGNGGDSDSRREMAYGLSP